MPVSSRHQSDNLLKHDRNSYSSGCLVFYSNKHESMLSCHAWITESEPQYSGIKPQYTTKWPFRLNPNPNLGRPLEQQTFCRSSASVSIPRSTAMEKKPKENRTSQNFPDLIMLHFLHPKKSSSFINTKNPNKKNCKHSRLHRKNSEAMTCTASNSCVAQVRLTSSLR